MLGRGPYSVWARMMSWAGGEVLDSNLEEGRSRFTIRDVYDDPFLEKSHRHSL